MPDRETTTKAKEDLREGKSVSTAAGEFVREEMDHVREGVHGARSPQQAIAIGLSKARRAGIPLEPPSRGKTSAGTRKKAEQDLKKGQLPRKPAKSQTLAAGPDSRLCKTNRHRQRATPHFPGTLKAPQKSKKATRLTVPLSSHAPNFCPCRSRPTNAMKEASTKTLIAVSAMAVA